MPLCWRDIILTLQLTAKSKPVFNRDTVSAANDDITGAADPGKRGVVGCSGALTKSLDELLLLLLLF